jgi:hypothetical protein
MKKLLTLIFTTATYLCSAQQAFYDVIAANGNGVRFWQNDNWKIHMGNAAEYHYGPVTDYSIKFNMDVGTAGRGWTWGPMGGTPVAALGNQGNMQIAGAFSSTGAINVGLDGSSTSGYGTLLNLLGASSNTDPLWLSRYNVGYNASELRMNIGDDNGGDDSFVIGNTFFQDGQWKPLFKVRNDGNVGIGTTNPNYKLEVSGGAIELDADQPLRGGGKWLISGNSSMVTVGTANPGVGLRFYAGDDISRMIIDASNGNVGIGTTTPGSSYKLDVNGTINAAGILINGAPFAGGGSQWTTAGSNVYYSTAGNVGIGTAAPNFKLELGANSQLAIGKTYVDNCLDANNSYVRSNFGSNVYWDGLNHVWQVKAIGNNDFSAMIHPNADGLAFVTAPSNGNADKSLTNSQFMALERMRITANGNVGIGTTAPDAKLAVAGQVHATEVRVTTSVPGPDYVFEKDYKLSSLEEIKNYIDQNKHLPEVPSAKEMEKNGVQLGEMNMLLLKKIEELTLHVIELKRENTELKEYKNQIVQLRSDLNKVMSASKK